MPNWCDCTISIASDDRNRAAILADCHRGIERVKRDKPDCFGTVIHFDRILADAVGTILPSQPRAYRPELQKLLQSDWYRSGRVHNYGGGTAYEFVDDRDDPAIRKVVVYGGFLAWAAPIEFLALYSSLYPDTTFVCGNVSSIKTIRGGPLRTALPRWCGIFERR
jgi:hypothetical protein